MFNSQFSDSLHVISNSDHHNRNHNKRFNLLQGTVREKSEQWIDENCPSFSQTIQNRTIYASQPSTVSTPSQSLKSRRKHKSKNHNHKEFKKRHKNKKKHRNKKWKKKIDIEPSPITNIKHPKRQKLLKKIKSTLTNTEYEEFRSIIRYLLKMKDSQNTKQEFNEYIMDPLLKLFNTPKRYSFLNDLKSAIPLKLLSFYKQRLQKLQKTKKKPTNNNLLDLYSISQRSQLSQISQVTDWKCSVCTLSNDSSECDFCGASKSFNNDANDIYYTDPLSQQPSMIKINGKELDKINLFHSNKIGDKLEELRFKLKEQYNINQLHHVFSAPVQNELSKYAPINIEQLKYFDITPIKINKYGSEIINVIKQYLHENGLISPFIKIMKTTNNEKKTNCIYCYNLFDENIITQHESQCVMNDGHQSPVLSLEIPQIDRNSIIIDDDHGNDEEKKIEIDVENDDDNDVNMNTQDMDTLDIDDINDENELDEIGFLTPSEIEKVTIDFKMNEIDYFHGIDDIEFAEMIEKEQNKENEENEWIELDRTGFINDDEILKCLKATEQQIKIKNNIKKELQEKKMEINRLIIKENQIKQKRENIQKEVGVLQQKLLNL